MRPGIAAELRAEALALGFENCAGALSNLPLADALAAAILPTAAFGHDCRPLSRETRRRSAGWPEFGVQDRSPLLSPRSADELVADFLRFIGNVALTRSQRTANQAGQIAPPFVEASRRCSRHWAWL